MNLETKITIYKFTPQLFTLTHKNTQSYILGCKKGCKSRKCLIYTLYCGERGIRTPGTSQFNGFQDRRNRPLCHLSSRFQHVLQSFCSQLRCKGKDYFRICKFLKHIFLIFSLSFIIHAWK